MFELWVCISSIVLGLCVTFKWCENDGLMLEKLELGKWGVTDSFPLLFEK